MATQINELTVNQKHWIKELNDMETRALDHLETFEEAAGVNTDELYAAKLLIKDAYEKARMAVTPL